MPTRIMIIGCWNWEGCYPFRPRMDDLLLYLASFQVLVLVLVLVLGKRMIGLACNRLQKQKILDSVKVNRKLPSRSALLAFLVRV